MMCLCVFAWRAFVCLFERSLVPCARWPPPGKGSGKAPKVKMNDPEYVKQLQQLLINATRVAQHAFENDVEAARALWVRALCASLI